ARRLRFEVRTTLLESGKTAVGMQVPNEIVAALGAGKRPPVRVTIKGYTYRNTIAVMGGVFMVGVNAENHRPGECLSSPECLTRPAWSRTLRRSRRPSARAAAC